MLAREGTRSRAHHTTHTHAHAHHEGSLTRASSRAASRSPSVASTTAGGGERKGNGGQEGQRHQHAARRHRHCPLCQLPPTPQRATACYSPLSGRGRGVEGGWRPRSEGVDGKHIKAGIAGAIGWDRPRLAAPARRRRFGLAPNRARTTSSSPEGEEASGPGGSGRQARASARGREPRQAKRTRGPSPHQPETACPDRLTRHGACMHWKVAWCVVGGGGAALEGREAPREKEFSG